MQHVKSLKAPPEVGRTYAVECVMGRPSNIGHHNLPLRLWPVFTPSHQDSVYFPRYRTIWGDDGESVDETYYEDDPSTPHHFHVDPRFTTEDMYTMWELENKSLHTIIRGEGAVEVVHMMCQREMPIQVLFTGFGKNFLDDHKSAKLKGCKRCPHKGMPLASMPVVGGKVTCPAHGLQFSNRTGKCLSRWEEDNERESIPENAARPE